jgi:hypothetical protein
MRTICLVLLTAIAAGCGADHRKASDHPTATGPTAREQTARDRRARALKGTRLLTIPWVAHVRWRYDADERFVTIIEVPAGGATGTVWMTAAGRRERIGWVHPGHRAESQPVREGPVEIRVVQSTEPATVIAKVRVVYARGRNSLSAAQVSARVRTHDHGR